MNTVRKNTKDALIKRDPVRDGLIVLCMTVVALALGIGLHLQFALAFWLAVVAALAVYVALLSTHILVRRSEDVDRLRRELSRLEGSVARTPVGVGGTPRSTIVEPVDAALMTGGTTTAAAEASRDGGAHFSDYWKFTPAAPDPVALPANYSAEHSLSVASEPVRTVSELRPPVQNLHATKTSVPNNRQREADAAQIDAVIKKLAADITQGQAAMAQAQNAVAVERQASPKAYASKLDRAVYMPEPAHTPPEIDASVEALHAAADAMRLAGKPIATEPTNEPLNTQVHTVRPMSVVPPPVPQRRLLDPARDRLAAIAEAIENERLDVMLEPILALGDRRAQHYVVTLRFWGDHANLMSETESGPSVRGSGLLPLLDAVKVERAARVAWRMEDRGKAGSLFSTLSGESLVSDRFLNRFADTYRQGDTLGSRLVLAFNQRDLRNFSDLQWSTLRDMADLGFRFSLEDITDLDFDFTALAAAGFAFVKLDAKVFLDGMPTSEGMVPAQDLCRHVSRLGLALIVGQIADDAVAARLKDYGVELAQGPLFGAPRPVKADVLRNPHAAVA